MHSKFFKKRFSCKVICKHTLENAGMCHIGITISQETRRLPSIESFSFFLTFYEKFLGILSEAAADLGKCMEINVQNRSGHDEGILTFFNPS